MTVKDALILLAQRSGGVLKGRDAVRVFMRIGIIRDRRSADAQIYTILNREAEFYKLKPGEYILVGYAPNGAPAVPVAQTVHPAR